MMSATLDPSRANERPCLWPWAILSLSVLAPIWYVSYFPDDIDIEFPNVVRPTFSRHAPPAYRLAEAGDTIDHVALYMAAAGVVIAGLRLLRSAAGAQPAGLWPAAGAAAAAAFWYTVCPGPTFDGYHGLGWRGLLDPAVPREWRLALAAAALGLAALALGNAVTNRRGLHALWGQARQRQTRGLWVAALVGILLRQVPWPGVEPAGYWPRCALVFGLLAFDLALLKSLSENPTGWKRLALVAAAGACWVALVAAGLQVFWFHRPIDRLRTVVPGRIYMSAIPTYRGLALAHQRHHFKTIINLFPEESPQRSPLFPDEVRFAREHGVNLLVGSTVVAQSDPFLDKTLALAQDPSAWPILVHCHGCMDRTPAWVGIYRFLVEGQPIGAVMRFIEQHRGYRPKASVTLLFNRVLAARAPERYAADPDAQRLVRCAAGTRDPYYDQLRAELERANPGASARVSERAGHVDTRRP